jgi:hydroxymethylpyrimidine pyrophosphatase-like HAD family hydrolase
MELFVFLDLDDTIFQTKRKCPVNEQIIPAAFGKDGSAMSFFTAKQARLFKLLNDKTRLVPTTARNYNSFLLTHIKEFDYAIINHGGIILNSDNTPHQTWFEKVSEQLQTVKSQLQMLQQYVKVETAKQNIPLRIRLIEDFGLSFYLVIKYEERHYQPLDELLNNIVEPYLREKHLDFYCHLNDNNLAVLPKFLNKACAVDFLQQELKTQYIEYLSFGIGDSLTDMPYMQLCDYFMTPSNSQIVKECINPHLMAFNSEA